MPHRGTALTPGPFNLKFKFSEDALPFRIAGMCFTGNNYGQGRIRQPQGSELEPRDRTPGRRARAALRLVVPGQGATAGKAPPPAASETAAGMAKAGSTPTRDCSLSVGNDRDQFSSRSSCNSVRASAGDSESDAATQIPIIIINYDIPIVAVTMS